MDTGINIYGGYVVMHDIAKRIRVIVVGLFTENGGWGR